MTRNSRNDTLSAAEEAVPLTKRNTATAHGAGRYAEPEQPDTDPQAGSGQLPTHNPPSGRGADGAKGGSR